MLPSSPSKHKKTCPQNIRNLHESIGRPNKQSRTGFLRDYTNNTSLHGFKYLGEKNISIVHKIWWSIAIILSTAACGYLLIDLWKKWTETPVIITFAESYTLNWEIPFPAVTICTPVKSRTSYNEYKYLKLKNTTRNRISDMSTLALVCNNPAFIESINTTVNESIIVKIIENSPTIENSIIRCKGIRLLDCSRLFSPILTEEGLCFTSNMLNPKDIYREDVLQYNYNFSNNDDNQGWEADEGYAENLPLKTYPRRGIGNGKKSCKPFYTVTKPEDSDFGCNLIYDEFKISFHSPNIIPRVSQHFNWIPVDTEVSFAIKPRMMTTSKRLINYRPEKRLCYFSNERYLKFFKNYTQENCELECLTNYTMAVCGCATYYMPRNANMPICSPWTMFACVKDELDDIQILQISSINKKIPLEEFSDARTEEKKIAKACNCLPSCTSISYDVEMSQTDIVKVRKYGKHKAFTSWEAMTYKLSMLNIFFKESRFISTERTELYGLIDLLANCGGLLGVCLGFSILSLFEIIYFFTIRLLSRYKSNKDSEA